MPSLWILQYACYSLGSGYFMILSSAKCSFKIFSILLYYCVALRHLNLTPRSLYSVILWRTSMQGLLWSSFLTREASYSGQQSCFVWTKFFNCTFYRISVTSPNGALFFTERLKINGRIPRFTSTTPPIMVMRICANQRACEFCDSLKSSQSSRTSLGTSQSVREFSDSLWCSKFSFCKPI